MRSLVLLCLCSALAAAQEDSRNLDARQTVALERALDDLTEQINGVAEKRVTIVWLIDSSNSMEDDRQRLRERLDEVFRKLSGKTEIRMAVVAFDKSIRLVTPFTEKIADIRKGIDAVGVAGAGDERPMAAVAECARLLGARSEAQRSICLVTDERGDDGPDVETAIGAATAAGARVFVFGRETPFGWEHAYERDAKLGIDVTVDAGPESAGPETLQVNPLCCAQGWLPCCRKSRAIHPAKRKKENIYEKRNPLGCELGFDQEVSSGFLPWSQARLAAKTGGKAYPIRSGAGYEPRSLAGYEPELCTLAEWEKRNQGDPLREAIVATLEALKKGGDFAMPASYITPKNVPVCVAKSQELEAQVLKWIKRIAAARAGTSTTAKESGSSKRWIAHRHLLTAQLYVLLFWLEQYRLAVTGPFPTHTEKDIVGLMAGEMRGNRARKGAADAELDRVIGLHPGTPWAKTAELLKSRMAGFDLKIWTYGTVTPAQGSK